MPALVRLCRVETSYPQRAGGRRTYVETLLPRLPNALRTCDICSHRRSESSLLLCSSDDHDQLQKICGCHPVIALETTLDIASSWMQWRKRI